MPVTRNKLLHNLDRYCNGYTILSNFLASFYINNGHGNCKTEWSVSVCNFSSHTRWMQSFGVIYHPQDYIHGWCCARSNLNYHHHRQWRKFWSIGWCTRKDSGEREEKTREALLYNLYNWFFRAHLSHFTQCYNCFMLWKFRCCCMYVCICLFHYFCAPHFPPYMHFFFFSNLKVHFLAHTVRRRNAHPQNWAWM